MALVATKDRGLILSVEKDLLDPAMESIGAFALFVKVLPNGGI